MTTNKTFQDYSQLILKQMRTCSPADSYKHRVISLEEAQLFDISSVMPTQETPRLNISECLYDEEDGFCAFSVPSSVHNYNFNLPFSSSFIFYRRYKEIVAFHIYEREPLMYDLTLILGYEEGNVKYSIYSGMILYDEEEKLWSFSFAIDKVTRLHQDIFKLIRTAAEALIDIDLLFSKISDHYYALDDSDSRTLYLRPQSKKSGATVRVAGKPVYIILDEKKARSKTQAEDLQAKYPQYKIMHSFPVRGHWRRLSSLDSIGKDRKGEYNQRGFTWVKECIKGSGELIFKRPYIVCSKESK